MGLNLLSHVTKISVSDVPSAVTFYTEILGFEVQNEYTLNSGGNFGAFSYVQLILKGKNDATMLIGLFKDIDKPFDEVPPNGTVPSFIVEDIEATLHHLQKHGVVIDPIDHVIIQENTSDAKKTDRFFFFQDLDRNSFVARQNM